MEMERNGNGFLWNASPFHSFLGTDHFILARTTSIFIELSEFYRIDLMKLDKTSFRKVFYSSCYFYINFTRYKQIFSLISDNFLIEKNKLNK
ncbi:hypothetical protein BpHYR1_000074 [Brachionus plicatilis]|uniref:Uncharacterized protein n=1 Tax=Brachionus plicatilis TaxID=10195 RepID=A0A3M7SEZ6_BRAPC|nr:hypothetical protein BpHYR1_000074 [Brachionus plicatilis]